MDYIKKNYHYLVFSFFLYSILFWFVEMGYSLAIRNKFVLPGAWHGPYCPIYGLTFLLLLAVFRKEDPIPLNVLKIGVVVTVTEYIISLISDKIFHNVIWNYSNKLLNINGRVCLEMSVIFTIIGTIIMYFFVPLTKKIYEKLGNCVKYINAFLTIMLFIDMIVSFIIP